MRYFTRLSLESKGKTFSLTEAENASLDRKRREISHSGGTDAFLFQPHTNYRTLDFDKPLSTRMAQKIVKKWADYSRLGDLSPHDLRRTAITQALEGGLSYRQCR